MSRDLHATFCENTRRRLRELGMKQREFAKVLDVSEAHVSQLLSGRFVPGLQTVEKIAKALHTNSLYLLTPVEAEKSELISISAVDGT